MSFLLHTAPHTHPHPEVVTREPDQISLSHLSHSGSPYTVLLLTIKVTPRRSTESVRDAMLSQQATFLGEKVKLVLQIKDLNQ